MLIVSAMSMLAHLAHYVLTTIIIHHIIRVLEGVTKSQLVCPLPVRTTWIFHCVLAKRLIFPSSEWKSRTNYWLYSTSYVKIWDVSCIYLFSILPAFLQLWKGATLLASKMTYWMNVTYVYFDYNTVKFITRLIHDRYLKIKSFLYTTWSMDMCASFSVLSCCRVLEDVWRTIQEVIPFVLKGFIKLGKSWPELVCSIK